MEIHKLEKQQIFVTLTESDDWTPRAREREMRGRTEREMRGRGMRERMEREEKVRETIWDSERERENENERDD